MKVRAIIFDLWDTIYDDDPHRDRERSRYRFEIISQKLKSWGYEVGEDELYEGIARSVRDSRHQWDTDYYTPNASQRLSFVMEHLGVSLSAEQLDELAHDVVEVGYNYPPLLFTQSKHAIETLAADYELAIISDTGLTSGNALRRILERDGLLPYFKVLTFSDEAGASKPHEKVFRMTIEQLGVPAKYVIHVGDHEVKDVGGAIATGLNAVHVGQQTSLTYQDSPSYYKIEHIGLLQDLLAYHTIGG